MRFLWDPDKDRANQAKHGVAFADAALIFDNPAACLDLFDDAHSDLEERFLTLGPARSGILAVVWTERDKDAVRIISARLATRREHALYRQHLGR